MNKKLSVFLFCAMFLCLTGCVTEKNRNEILAKLAKENIIKEDWQYLKYDALDASPIPDIYAYEYFYKDSDDNFYAVMIQNAVKEKDSEDAFYPVIVSDHLEETEGQEQYRDEETDELKTRTVRKYDQTDNSEYVHYKADRNKILFWTYWKIKPDERYN